MDRNADRKRNAEDCRALARSMPSERQRAALLDMADAWDRLASGDTPRPDDAEPPAGDAPERDRA